MNFHWGCVVVYIYYRGWDRYLVIVCVSWCVRLCTILIFFCVERELKRQFHWLISCLEIFFITKIHDVLYIYIYARLNLTTFFYNDETFVFL